MNPLELIGQATGQLGALHQLLQQNKQETDQKLYPGLVSDDPKQQQLAQLHRSLGNLGMGATLGSDVSFAVPSSPSVEQMSNLAGGWKQPGVKSQFDYGMLIKDPKILKETLPAVPEQYLQSGFGPQVYETLLKVLKQTAPQIK